MRRRVILETLTALLAAAYPLAAQTPRPSQPSMPAWDSGFSVGLITNSARDEGDHNDNERSSVHAEGRLAFGHYWTQHVKTETAVSFLNRWEDYDYETFPVPGLRGGGYSFTNKSIRMTVVTPALTYQFLENQFAHPYVSAGARIGFLQTHSVRYPQTVTQAGVTYSVSALDRRDSTLVVRPTVAAGFKSYFNERAFVRTEGETLFSADGTPHVSLRIGVGIDF